jgi:nitric oxide reductase subunit B
VDLPVSASGRVYAAETIPARRFATLTFLRGALIAIGVTLIGGFLAALYSVPWLAPAFQSVGLDLRQLRPIHTTFAAAWIFLGGVAVVYRFLQEAGPVTEGDRWRLRVQVLAWAAAGLGILLTLLLGIGSGREYMGFHPAFSVLILIGWICYGWNFFRIVGGSFWSQPVHVTMWGVGVLFFTYTFIEQHAYLLSGVFADPVHDLRVQWKATGTLVGSFNLLCYGTVVYVGERMSADGAYGRSRIAYALLGVGLLNSFTNFAHHTYHLPQRPLVVWISFIVSMTEILILARVVTDVWKMVAARDTREYSSTRALFTASKWWTIAILFSSILISIPPMNAVIHGTYVVTGHAMGATIGIDTMILLAAIIWILEDVLNTRGDTDARTLLHSGRVRRTVISLNVAVAVFVGWLHVSGLVTGLTRMTFSPGETYVPPTWLGASSAIVFALAGIVVVEFFIRLLRTLIPIAFRPFSPAGPRS